MKKGNNLRVNILSGYRDGNCEMSFSELLVAFMKVPSYIEKGCCSGKEIAFPIVRLHTSFQNNFKNMEHAIENNFPPKVICRKCNISKTARTFSTHIFIEVRQML